jgi:hypothetical protein
VFRKERVVESINLIVVSLVAFSAVFLLLTILAAAMHLITLVFPVRKVVADSAFVAAITAAVASAYPGARVTRIEEET